MSAYLPAAPVSRVTSGAVYGAAMPPRRRALHAGLVAIPLLAILTGCTTTTTTTPSPTTVPSETRASSPQPSFFDRGSQQYATGSAQLVNGAYRYVVAAGDTARGIANRFGTSDSAVAAASRGGYEIFEGDTLRITH